LKGGGGVLGKKKDPGDPGWSPKKQDKRRGGNQRLPGTFVKDRTFFRQLGSLSRRRNYKREKDNINDSRKLKGRHWPV